MQNPVKIENIEEMRFREGIDDTELRQEIRGLKVGDVVKLTFLTGASSFETVLVRITSIRDTSFRGKLTSRPTAAGLAKLRTGESIAFTAAHIHSIPRRAQDQ